MFKNFSFPFEKDLLMLSRKKVFDINKDIINLFRLEKLKR